MTTRFSDSRTLTLGLGGLAVAGFCVLSGCSSGENRADFDHGAELSEAEVTSLRGAMVLKGAVAVGSTKTVHYAPSDASASHTLPYLAVEIVPAATRATTDQQAAQTVTVSGGFPGAPRVLVVDEAFQVLAKTTAVKQPDGTALAELAAPLSAGKRFLLVRDNLWSREMSFQVNVGP